MLKFISKVWCWIATGGEHEYVYRFEPTRVNRICLHCGRETPGWEVAPGRIASGRETARVLPFKPKRKLAYSIAAIGDESSADDSRGTEEVD